MTFKINNTDSFQKCVTNISGGGSGSTDIRASNFGSTGEIQWNIWFCTDA